MSSIYQQYQRLKKLPAGSFIFNKAIGFTAPFFGKIKPNVLSLRPSFCEVEMKDRWGIRNHLGTINAGALCSLAELTGGMALDSVVPCSMRWIPKGMTVRYLQKAVGTLVATSEFDFQIVSPGELIIPIVVKNREQEIVFEADINFYVSEKPARKNYQ